MLAEAAPAAAAAPAAPPPARPLGFNWPVSEAHGWGLVGLHTALHLLERGQAPLLLADPMLDTLRPAVRARLAPWLGASEPLRRYVATCGARQVLLSDADLMFALSGELGPPLDGQSVRGVRNIGVGAFTATRFPPGAIEGLAQYDRVIVHSGFNRLVLEEHGVSGVETVPQGVDPTEVGPGPRPGAFPGRFVVFSGGKLEFRKGQDLVLAAFRAFHARHPEALLLTAWANLWPALAATIAESPLVVGPPAPRADGHGLDIAGWIAAQGLAEGSFLDLGFLGRDALAPVLRDCDLAVFPNRCEPGTNLVAMEAMACGVPVVLSANTGHLDLIAPGRCLALHDQRPVHDPEGDARRHWGESRVEELLEAMEAAWRDREAARAMGEAGSSFVLGERTWAGFAEAFVAAATA